MLVLVMSGEIWPLSPQDVQFAMPASLVPAEVAKDCWSPDLLQSWRDDKQVELDTSGPMLEARREAVRILRKVSKEKERMCGRLLGAESTGGGIEGVWEQWATEGRTDITAAECAEYLVNAGRDEDGAPEKRIKIKKNTLPAYAAHTLMMDRPDLFVADTGEMWKSGDFMVRARVDRERFIAVQSWFDGTSDIGKAIAEGFTAKAKAAIAFSRSIGTSDDNDVVAVKADSLPDWTAQELDIISVLYTRLYEVRSTQFSPAIPLSYLIMKTVNCYPGEPIEQPLVKRFLLEIGMMSPHDSLERSRAVESDRRNMALKGISGQTLGPDDLLQGHELDDLREDFTGHTVYVIDDASASELDDGISVERVEGGGYWLHVHVADPTRYLRPDHPTSVRASFQASALYTPEGNIPLLPLDITMKQLSLGADTDKQGVMTFSALISDTGEVQDEKVRMSWIKSPRVVTYSAVNEALSLSGSGGLTRPFGLPVAIEKRPPRLGNSKPVNASDLADLRVLHDLAVKHRKRRYADSGLEFFLPQPSLNILSDLTATSNNVFDPSTLPATPRYASGLPTIDYLVPGHSDVPVNAQAMVAECMILAGKLAAFFCHKNGIPAPFRGSERPKIVTTPSSSPSAVSTPTSIESLLSQRNEYGVIDPFMISASHIHFTAGNLSAFSVPHWVMGLTQPDTGYLRATSPLRRFDDLLVHWQIKSHLARARGIKAPWPSMSADEILMLGRRQDVGQKRNKRAGGNAMSWWTARLVASRLQSSLPARYRATPETIDFSMPLDAKVADAAVANSREGVDFLPVWVPALASPVTVVVPRGTEIPMGQDIRVKITEAQLDPVPRLLATPA